MARMGDEFFGVGHETLCEVRAMSDLMTWLKALAWWQQCLLILTAAVTVLWGVALMEGLFAPRARYWYWGGK